METKQTAVDWVFDKIIRCYEEEEWIRLIEEAKQMEKEQMIEFADEYADAVMGGCIKRAEEYYNETYGN